jgi:hypothetical protein
MMRLLASLFVAQMLLGQAAASKKWTPPQTAFGQPDLEGIWTNVTITPLERPAEFAGKAFFTPQEAAAFERATNQRNNADNREADPVADVNHAYNQVWWDRGTKVGAGLRTSLIIDPPDGRIPPLTPARQKQMQELLAYNRTHSTDGPENRLLSERCLLWGTAGPPMLPSFYNNNYQIVQTRDSVAILVEMIHDVRMIPLGGRPHLAANIRQWMGDPRGHWEGDTLVVDNTNFTDKTRFRGADENLHLTERFTRVGPDMILYEFTVDDPTAFTRPWTAQIPMMKAKGPIFEYACHEGNYAMTDILAGARAAEKTAENQSAK